MPSLTFGLGCLLLSHTNVLSDGASASVTFAFKMKMLEGENVNCPEVSIFSFPGKERAKPRARGEEDGDVPPLSRRKTQKADMSALVQGAEVICQLCESSFDNPASQLLGNLSSHLRPSFPPSGPTQRENKPQQEMCPLKCQTPRAALEHGHP